MSSKRLLLTALTAHDDDLARLSQTSAYFRSQLYTLAELLPSMVNGLAETARGYDERMAAVIEENMRKVQPLMIAPLLWDSQSENPLGR